MALAETAKLAIDLSLTGNAAAGLKGVEQRLTGLNSRVGKLSGGFKTLGAGIGVAFRNAAVLGIAALGGLTALIAKSVKEGQDAAKVQTIYAVAIRNSAKSTGTFTEQLKAANANLAKAEGAHKKNAAAIQKAKDALAALKGTQQFLGPVTAKYVQILNDQQTALMNLGGVDDELIKSEQTRLIQMGLNGAAVAKLTPLILDFSKATGTDLLTATKLVGKSVNGNVGALARYGVMIDKAKAKTDPFGATVDALNKKFGGTTKALSGSLDARLGAFRENMANIREELGIRLLPALTRIVDVAGKDLVPAFGKFIDRIMPSLISGLDTFASMLENGGAERGIRAITDALGPMVSLLQIAAKPVKLIVDAFLRLPSNVQGALVAGFAINKLSGGLIAKGAGDIGGGLIGTIAQGGAGGAAGGILGRLFGRGSSPATPMFVSDVSKGVGGIAGAAGGGLGLASKVFLVGEAIGLGVIVNEVRQNMADQNTAASESVQTSLSAFLAKSPSRADLQSALDGVEQGIRDIQSNPLNVLVQGEALDNLRTMRDDLRTQLQKDSAGLFGLGAVVPALVNAITTPQRSADARSAGMRGIVERASRAGFHPTQAAVTATYERNVKRAAEAQQRAADKTKLAGDRLISAALILTRAGERLSNVRIPTFSPPRPAGAPPIYANPTGPGHHLAGGGLAQSWESYLVGERGPEILRMGSRSGAVIPNRAGGPTAITVKAVATTRDISTASTVKGRMGPTISQAGGI